MLPNKPEAQNLVVNNDQLVEVIQQQFGPDILEFDDTESQPETLIADKDALGGQTGFIYQFRFQMMDDR